MKLCILKFCEIEYYLLPRLHIIFFLIDQFAQVAQIGMLSCVGAIICVILITGLFIPDPVVIFSLGNIVISRIFFVIFF